MCISAMEATSVVGIAGLTLFVITLFEATLAQAYPLSQLGIRPKGRGLLEWNYNFIMSGVGVVGYDPILGALSPHLRLQFHVANCLLSWSIMIVLLLSQHLPATNSVPMDCTTTTNTLFFFPLLVWYTGLLTFLLYFCLFYYYHYILPGVSDPGGPRLRKIQRQPQWCNKTWELPLLNKWRCVSAQESHTVSAFVFRTTKATLTGEPAGRDIWTTTSTIQSQQQQQQKSLSSSSSNPSPQQNNINPIDETVVDALAASGRESGFNPAQNPNNADIPYRKQKIREYIQQGKVPPSIDGAASGSLQDVIRQAVHFYSMLQCDDGHWAGDYGGPHFLLPGLIVAWYVMGRPTLMFAQDDIDLMIPYIVTHQQLDGGWGTHLESPSTMFGTTLMYVALRCLGISDTDPVCCNGRTFLQAHGGAIMTSSWAKFYLCILGVMDWKGHNVVPAEMWLLPNWMPFHPGRMWCHARMVYLPMGYLFGSRFVYPDAERDPLVLSLRKELYCESYHDIDWINTRSLVAPMDNYSPVSWIMKFAQSMLIRYEYSPFCQPFRNFVRRRGLKWCLEYMHAEDLQTNFIDIGPVNKVLNMLSTYHNVGFDIQHPDVANHMIRVADYMWVAEDGMKMKGYNGSQCWDTSFAIQGICEAGLLDEFPDVSKRVWNYLERCQILSTEVSQKTMAYKYESAEFRKRFYRHISEGGWPFSTSAHGWPITDCTGEGLKGVLCLRKCNSITNGVMNGSLRDIEESRLQKAANILLTYQNEDGGFATYENNRGYAWYELFNPSEVFGDIMIDYSYVECSMASLTALVDFHNVYPKYRTKDIRYAIDHGRTFLKDIQRPDGSWYGSWACCFCYGCWFGVEGLVKCGEPVDSPSILKACKFMLQHQRPNGGWGEDFTSCYDKDYARDGMKEYGDDGSGVVNTAWALLALSIAECDSIEAIKYGVRYLKTRQLPCGDWPQEGIAGVFNRACGISYTAYRNIFPIWALARCRVKYGDIFDEKIQ